MANDIIRDMVVTDEVALYNRKVFKNTEKPTDKDLDCTPFDYVPQFIIDVVGDILFTEILDNNHVDIIYLLEDLIEDLKKYGRCEAAPPIVALRKCQERLYYQEADETDYLYSVAATEINKTLTLTPKGVILNDTKIAEITAKAVDNLNEYNVRCNLDFNAPKYVDFTATPTSGDSPLTVQFELDTNYAYDSVSWTYADGVPTDFDLISPEHVFEGDDEVFDVEVIVSVGEDDFSKKYFDMISIVAPKP